ncbi:hypothetical protein [Streptomyces sp. NPDC018000]|uniref:hypothetical protein n=1 Tax=Streptomyces sp. NPDC018000 TaxID=3365028 RepID=UPI00379571A7
MSQQHPGPQQPYQTQPQQPYGQPYQGAPYPPAQFPKPGMSTGAKVAIIVGCVLGIPFLLLIVIGIAVGGSGGDSGKTSPDKVAVAPKETTQKNDAKPAEKTEQPAEKLRPVDEFKAFVAKNGTSAEQAAVKHVTNVQVPDEMNDLLDTADIHTDFSGGIMSKDQGKAKLLASAFADWKQSENGLVSVYGSDGKLIANGNF